MIYQLSPEYFVRPLQESDLEGPYPTWFEDLEVCRYNSHGKFPKNEEYLREYVRAANGEDRVVWAVCHVRDGHIGNVSLQALSIVNRAGEFAILMGDKRHWGTGVATMAARTIVGHGFRKLNLNRIYCGTAATNEGMKKLAKAIGMTQEGVRRDHLFLDGAWVDVVEYGILASEFNAQKK
jgi:[ribosomal protein S5]-alanine N-acetyltransferase